MVAGWDGRTTVASILGIGTLVSLVYTLCTCGGSSSSEPSSGTGSGCLDAACPSSAHPPRGSREKWEGARGTVPGSVMPP